MSTSDPLPPSARAVPHRSDLAPHDDVVLPEPGYAGEPDPSPPPGASHPWLWFSAVGGLAAYFTHLLITFWWTNYCTGADRLFSVVTTVVFAAVAAAATWAGWRALRALRRDQAEREQAERERAGREREAAAATASRPGGAARGGPAGRGPGRFLIGLWALARAVRQPRPSAPTGPAHSWDPVPDARVRQMLAVAGIALSGLSLAILLVVGVSVLLVPPCA